MALLRPIQGPTALRFWSSAHKCNRIRAICAYSLNAEDANRNLTRFGYTSALRKKIIEESDVTYNNVQMTGIPYNTGNVYWWDCLFGGGSPITAPIVQILHPREDDHYAVGTEVEINPAIEEGSGNITDVIYYINNEEIHRTSNIHAAYSWTMDSTGNKVVKVVAQADDGIAGQDIVNIVGMSSLKLWNDPEEWLDQEDWVEYIK